MMDLLTPQTIASAGPILLDTLFRHVFSHKSLMARSSARGDDLMYDEAFVLMKTFLESATKYPLVSLQRFSNVRTPAPPWVGVHRVLIPSPTLRQAAKYLIEALGGPEMAYKIAGGSRWWQVRAGGLEGEWIAMKKDYEPALKEERERQKARRKSAKARVSREKGKVAEGKLGGEDMGQEDGPGEGQGDEEDDGFRQEMNEMRCMLYIHGGAYYWGSINTHRYTIWRYARKMRGRCFAVNYRKAPQYPFPCAIQDCLAAYLYLVDPPPDAQHKAVKPEHIVIAGDSAGGGLTLALLQILRDVQALSLPAGAALISPWSDLTHSFPSILSNTATDIVPPYSFIHKPSSLWPPPPIATTSAIQSGIRHKIRSVASRIRHAGSHSGAEDDVAVEYGDLYDFESERILAARTVPEASSSGEGTPADDSQNIDGPNTTASSHASGAATPARSVKSAAEGLAMVGQPFSAPPKFRSSNMNKSKLSSFFKSANATLHPTTHRKDPGHSAEPHGEPRERPSRANPADAYAMLGPVPRADADTSAMQGGDKQRAVPTTLADCALPLRLDVHGERVEIDTQVQIYATNAQLCHPLVSPALGYLGGLCPLYVMCGDNEVLRDEIIYLAHKAANPEKYPIRADVRAMMPHYAGIEARYGPSKVHLQVYDGVCHDLPLFSMCRSARGLFRAISTFARHVTPSATSGTRGSTSSKSRAKSQPLPVHEAGNHNLGSYPASDAENDDVGCFEKAKTDPLTGDGNRAASRRGTWWASAVESMTPGRLSRRSSGSLVGSGTSTPAVPTSASLAGGSGTVDETPGTQATSDIARPIIGISTSGKATVPLPLGPSETQISPVTTFDVAQPTELTNTVGGDDLARRLDRLDVGAARKSTANTAVLPEAEKTASPMSLRPSVARTTSDKTSQKSSPVRDVFEASPAGSLAGTQTGDRSHHHVGTGTGDESGPRWAHDTEWEGPAKEGEAGHPSVYIREDAWHDNMIRERVDSHGRLRPLEPAEELGALQMPADEIGMIKEGAALRYLTGQYLWDKKYSHARKTVARHREKNLKAHAKDVGRLVEGVKRRLGIQEHEAGAGAAAAVTAQREAEQGTHGTQGTSTGSASAPMSRVTSGGSSSTVSSFRSDRSVRGEEEHGQGQGEYDDWSWAWALDGDVPPPSAIVSRRDTAEARKLALTADHTDSAKASQMSGLSIWIALTTFFSNSAERNKAKDVIQAAKDQEGQKVHGTGKAGQSGGE